MCRRIRPPWPGHNRSPEGHQQANLQMALLIEDLCAIVHCSPGSKRQRRPLVMRFTLWAPLVIVLAGCESAKEPEQPLVISTPLEHDPTHRIELARWWF